MRCTNCGVEFSSNFCPNCGAKASADSTVNGGNAAGFVNVNDGMYVNNLQSTGQTPYANNYTAYPNNIITPVQENKPAKKPVYKRVWFWILIVVAALIIIVAILPDGSDYDDTSDNGVIAEENVDENAASGNKTITEPGDNKGKNLSDSEVLAQIEKQSFKVISTEYVVQDEEYKNLYPDMLQAVVKNNTKYEIKNAVIAFVAWDKNNLPVKIKGQFDFSGGSYISEVNYSDINLVPGSSYGNDSGLSLDDEGNQIAKFKAIAVSYETFDGEKWENPYYNDWCEIYGGKKLK